MDKFIKYLKDKKIILIVVILIIALIIGLLAWYSYIQNKKYSIEDVKEINYYRLSDNNLSGVIDKEGNIIIETIYDSVKIPNPEKPVFICQTGEECFVFNDVKEQLFIQYDEVREINLKGIVSSIPYEKSVLKYKKDGKYGLINYNGKVITKPIYDEIEGLEHKEGEMLVKKGDKYGVINSKGATIVNAEYDSIIADGYYDSNGKYAFSGYIIGKRTDQGYRYGYINYKLKKLLEVEYNDVERILSRDDSETIYLFATKNGQKGVLRNNELIINYAYQEIEYDDYNETFILTRGTNKGVANINGNIIIPISYKEINVNGIYFCAIKDEEINYFNNKGELLKDVAYNSVLKTENPDYYITISSDGNYNLINSSNKNIFEKQYRYLEYLFDDYFIASNSDGYLGVINSSEDVIIDFKYEVLQRLDNTKVIEAKILADNLTEIYSNELQNVYSKQNAFTSIVDNSYIEVYSQDETKYFDLNGNELKNVQVFERPLYASKKEDKWGFIDKEGNIVVDYIYDRVSEFNEYGFAGIKLDGKWGIIDKNGKIIVEPTYEISNQSRDPEFIGSFYKVYYGYGESYYTNKIAN